MKDIKTLLNESRKFSDSNIEDILKEETISITWLVNQINNIKDSNYDWKKAKIVFKDTSNNNYYPITDFQAIQVGKDNTMILNFTGPIK